MNFKAHYAQMLANYTRWAQLPGAREYVWDRLQQLARECPELYADLPAQVTAAVKEQRDDRSQH